MEWPLVVVSGTCRAARGLRQGGKRRRCSRRRTVACSARNPALRGGERWHDWWTRTRTAWAPMSTSRGGGERRITVMWIGRKSRSAPGQAPPTAWRGIGTGPAAPWRASRWACFRCLEPGASGASGAGWQKRACESAEVAIVCLLPGSPRCERRVPLPLQACVDTCRQPEPEQRTERSRAKPT